MLEVAFQRATSPTRAIAPSHRGRVTNIAAVASPAEMRSRVKTLVGETGVAWKLA